MLNSYLCYQIFKMSRPPVIGITGRKFNGKDTLGNYYVEHHGYIRLAFADALKKGCAEIFSFTDEQLYGNKKEEIDEFWKVSPRTVLQYIGTELLREQLSVIMPEVAKNIWIKVVEKKMIDTWKVNPNAKFVITDVRFPNECQFVKDMGGILVRVTRESLNTNNDTHVSEKDIENLIVDFDLQNNDTKEQLFKNADEMLGYLCV